MTDQLKKALAAVEGQAAYEAATKETQAMPPEYKPGITWAGRDGEITTPPVSKEKLKGGVTPGLGNWDEYLIKYGFDPDQFEILEETVRFSAWDGWTRDNPGEEAYQTTLYSFKATIRPKRADILDPDWAEMFESIRSKKSKRGNKQRASAAKPEATFIINLSDWQVGNSDNGGVPEQLQAIADLPEKLVKAIEEARNVYTINHVVIAGLGDLHENCQGFYDHQSFVVPLNMREQKKIVRRGIREVIFAIHPIVAKLTVLGVGGNHGENRNNSKKMQTDKSDNTDVEVFEILAEQFSMNKDFANIQWVIPIDELAVSIQVGEQIVAFTHGHLSQGKGGGAMNAMWKWWTEQAHGRHFPGVADADILICGHYHHHNSKVQTGRALYMAPSLTMVSAYFGDRMGTQSSVGTMTMVVTEKGHDLVRLTV